VKQREILIAEDTPLDRVQHFGRAALTIASGSRPPEVPLLQRGCHLVVDSTAIVLATVCIQTRRAACRYFMYVSNHLSIWLGSF
jgi:hypothetical protein